MGERGSTAPGPLQRRGARPLLLHLTLAMLRSTASLAASPNLNGGWPTSKATQHVLGRPGLTTDAAQAKAAAHYITPNPGGCGAGRDAVDFILAAQGKLESVIEAFLDADNPAAAAADISTGRM